MNEETRKILMQLAARLTPEVCRQVRRRAGNRCEGWIDDPRMKRSGERCTARGDDLDFYASFWAELGDDPYTAADVSLLCEECYESSEDAEQQRHFDYLLSKDD